MQSGSDQFGGKSHAGGSRGGVNVQTLTNVHFDEATVYEPAQVRSPTCSISVADADRTSSFSLDSLPPSYTARSASLQTNPR